MHRDGSDAHSVGRIRTIAQSQLSWAPTDHALVFTSPSFAITTVRPDGSGLHEITHTDAITGSDHAWSPDGRTIIFVGVRVRRSVPVSGQGLFAVHPNGTDLHLLAQPPKGTLWVYPNWSPGGKHIALIEFSRSGALVKVMNSQGHDETTLVKSRVPDHPEVGLTWSPDGRWIAYVDTGGTKTPGIWAVPAGGGAPHRLFNGAIMPNWGR
jgi:Tol biopolymer transport system component